MGGNRGTAVSSDDGRMQTRIQAKRRQQLIEAAIDAIAEEGLSRLTVAMVAGRAGLTPAMVNFHFETKDSLLLGTLRHLSDELRHHVKSVMAAAADDPRARLRAFIEAEFDPLVCDPRKIAVWSAFWGESQARAEYQKVCGQSDQAYGALCHGLFGQALGPDRAREAEALSQALLGLIEYQWQNLLADPAGFDARAATSLCLNYLDCELAPRDEAPVQPSPLGPAVGAAPRRWSLPAWSYCNERLFAMEARSIHLCNWQFACHISQIPDPGCYATFELLGRKAIIVRGRDGEVRAFHNLCRHRAHAVVADGRGRCPGFITCPYHGWSYDLAGRLRGVPDGDTLPPLDRGDFGLRPIEAQTFLGFVFLRFEEGDGRGVAERLGTLGEVIAAYGTESLVPIGGAGDHDVAADWKVLWDNYLENYHFPTGHPGLSDLTEQDYEIRGDAVMGTAYLWHKIKAAPAQGWSARAYQSLSRSGGHPAPHLAGIWRYVALFPGAAFDLFPEHIDLLQILPLGPGRSRVRWLNLGRPRPDRRLRALRYLNGRINVQVQREDERLCQSVQRGLASGQYHRGPLVEKERALAAFHAWIAHRLPDADAEHPPAA